MITKEVMKLTQQMLREFEGERPYSYDDATGQRCNDFNKAKGHITIGVGHKVLKGKENHFLFQKLTPLSSRLLLMNDIYEHEIIAQRIFVDYENLTRSKKVFCLLMAFNLGNHLKQFRKANKLFNQRNYIKAIDEYKNSLWAKQVGESRVIKTTDLLRY
jgi:GH24 family phage-related lysozyme (muramidase)